MRSQNAQPLAALHDDLLVGSKRALFAFIHHASHLTDPPAYSRHWIAARAGSARPDVAAQRGFDGVAHRSAYTLLCSSDGSYITSWHGSRSEEKAMESKEFVEILMRRCMAQTLEEFEQKVEQPLLDLHGSLSNGVAARRISTILDGCYETKRVFRKKIQSFESDCLALIPRDLDINAVELVRRAG